MELKELFTRTSLVIDDVCTLEEADVVVVGVPFDSTTVEVPGTRFGPNAIREDFRTHLNSFDPELGELKDVKLYDAGNVRVLHGNVAKTNDLIFLAVKKILELNSRAKILTLGGEHSITYPVVKALHEAWKFSYLCYDAHTDLWDKFSDIELSHACGNKRIYDLLKKVEVRGFRTGEKAVFDFARSLPKVKDPVYLSLDVDVFSDKVGCPVAGFLDFETVWSEVKRRSIVAADVVEYNPMVGKDIRVAELVKRLILKLSR